MVKSHPKSLSATKFLVNEEKAGLLGNLFQVAPQADFVQACNGLTEPLAIKNTLKINDLKS